MKVVALLFVLLLLTTACTTTIAPYEEVEDEEQVTPTNPGVDVFEEDNSGIKPPSIPS